MIYRVINKEVQWVDLVELENFLKEAHTLALDCETRALPQYVGHEQGGLSPHLSEMVALQLGNDRVQFVIDVRKFSDSSKELKSELFQVLKLLENPSVKVIGQNIVFDYQILKSYGITLNHVYDTMIAEQVLRCGIQQRGFSLEALAAKYLDFHYHKTNQLDIFDTQFNDRYVGDMAKSVRQSFRYITDKPFTETQLLYMVLDVSHPYQIYFKQLRSLFNQGLVFVNALEQAYVLVLGDISYKGMYLNKEQWLELYENNLQKLIECKDELKRIAHNDPRLQHFTELIFDLDEEVNKLVNSTDISVNLDSSKQVIEICHALKLDVTVEKLTKAKKKTTGQSVEESVLKKYAAKEPFIECFLRYKKYQKAISTTGKGFILQHINPATNRVHSQYKQVLNTGRIASANPNLQNIPNESKFPGFRECFQSSAGSVLCIADYSSQESRIMADAAAEEAMISFFRDGDGDLHSYTARLMFNKEVTSEKNADLRSLAKRLNFGIPYGMSATKLSNDFNVSIEQAEEFIRQWFASYPMLKTHFDQCFKYSLLKGHILIDKYTLRKSYLGSIHDRYLDIRKDMNRLGRNAWELMSPEQRKEYGSIRSKIRRHSQNYPIQGLGASMTKLAAVLLRKELMNEEFFGKVAIINMVHDEIVLESDLSVAHDALRTLIYNMEKASATFSQYVGIPAEGVLNHWWGKKAS